MSDVILHHFDISPFGEKARLAMGLKGLHWRSVQIPLVMPKPDLTALTGGYRKTPVLQIGADIYCDTRRIALELDSRLPGHSLFPGGSGGTALALAHWSDACLFRPGAGLSLATNDGLPEDILNDRMSFFDFLDSATLSASIPHFYGQFRAGLQQLDDMLSDGRPWLLGDTPGWVDIACYTPLWMCRGNIAGGDALLAPLGHLLSWEQRVQAIGHGQREEMPAGKALEIARQADSTAVSEVLEDGFPRLTLGTRVSVSADDYGRDGVDGDLLRLTHRDIAVRRVDERAGEVVVHFPRAGYRVEAL